MAPVRVRQHVNPLNQRYQQPIEPPNWEQIYANPDQPLHLDIGCAHGHFLLQMAQQHPHWNFLGLEIRRPLVEPANLVRDQLQLTNLHYLFCNANIALDAILSGWTPSPLQYVTVQFPDPWFKKRHQKRRIVQPKLVAQLAHELNPGGRVLLQSDVEAVAMEMCDRFTNHPAFSRPEIDWLAVNPLPVSTEREQYILLRGEPIYRATFVRI
ncbi:MAG: tRNA (guanosine(46)-N7)-methyltransferase TrmB [Cyanothece sp. SIO1E1]|nr:tRNA (guanosine(46)-N7)-methyltransferase TrmB [Cyanothece sp. SIO1E1]